MRQFWHGTGTSWDGYQVYVTETCDNSPADDGLTDPAQAPNLITSVATTHAAVADSAMTMPIHTMLAARDLLPDCISDLIAVIKWP